VSQRTTIADSDEHAIRANYTQLRSLVAAAEHSRDTGKLEEAAGLACASATFAWFNHAGVFSDAALERLLVDMSGRVPDIGPPAPRSFSDVRQRIVVHIASELYPTGGHTQMLSRWIADDGRSQHRVVVTRQGWQPIPDKVTKILGDRPICLDGRYRSHFRRAAALRRICSEADIVVVHAHPDDIQPTLALGATTRPCVVVNHASHVFWVGTSIARTTLHLRRSAQDLAITRRGLPADGSFLMDRPLALPDVDVRRAEARAHFGVGDGQVVIATAAAANKYLPLDDGVNLVQLLVREVKTHPRLIVLAAGPRAEGQWLSAQDSTAGRIRALGPLRSVGSLLAAADIYIDSFPFSSTTSLLEAGAYSLPLVSYRGHGPGCEVLGADPPAVEDEVLYPKTPDEFHRVVSELVAGAEVRESRGARLREMIAATHNSAAVQEMVEALYEFAQRSGAAEGAVDIGDIAPQSGALDRVVRQIQQRTGLAQGIDAVRRWAMGSMPFRARTQTWRRLKHSGVTVRIPELLRQVDRVRLLKARYFILRGMRAKWVDGHLG
jgi:glycosyltransferase involved in cell wall biosynthesis